MEGALPVAGVLLVAGPDGLLCFAKLLKDWRAPFSEAVQELRSSLFERLWRMGAALPVETGSSRALALS